MAEFALGLTKTAVEGTLSRVRSAIEEDAKLKIRVQNDLLFITGEFQMMRSFLDAANAERAKNEVVRTWVRQVRDLAFDVEDCVEFVIHLDKGSPRTNWFWRALPSCIAPPLPLDEAVTELKQLKARVEDVSQRNTRYNLISDTGSSSKHPVSASSLVPELMPISTEVGATADTFDHLSKVWESTGKLRGTADLRTLINNEGDDLEVISLWQSPGAGHLGVTHVIRQAYNDPEINRIFKSRAWIKLMHPFSPDEFLQSLLTQVYVSSHHQANIGVVDFRKKLKAAVATEDELMQQLCEQKYLVIVEELSTVVEWEAIRMNLPNSKNGCRIVVVTQQLGLALSCTGDPYQVSILRQLSDGQSLCAFSNKVCGRRSDMSELIWQLRRPGVVTVWSDDDDSLIDKVYTCITHMSKEIDGVGFQRHVRVDLSYEDFCRSLLLSFHSDDFQHKEIREVFIAGDGEIIERCRRFLHENECLVVIDGLRSSASWRSWQSIKATLLSEQMKSSIIILVDTQWRYATNFVPRVKGRTFNAKDLDADYVLRHSVKDYDYWRFEGREESSMGCLFPKRWKKASEWINKFQHMVPLDIVSDRLLYRLKDSGVTSFWGTAGDWSSAIARNIYYKQLIIGREKDISRPHTDRESNDLGFIYFSWIEVPHPFDLTDLCWRMLLDFFSDNINKLTEAMNLISGDPVQWCHSFLHQHKCLVVVRGLQSTHEWDLMRYYLLSSERISGMILVITNDASVATYCVGKDGEGGVSMDHYRVLRFTGLGEKYGPDAVAQNNRRRIFSSRMEEARDWFNKFKFIGHGKESQGIVKQLQQRDSCVIVSLWGIAGVWKSDVVRSIYYSSMIGIENNYYGFMGKAAKYSWVDVPHPFNLTDLCRRLLMDFHSDDLAAKETMMIGMMEGQDPIQECRKLLHQDICFVVIRGLRSIDDWGLIKVALLPEYVKGCILVITNTESVATHCAQKEERVINVKGLGPKDSDYLFGKIIEDDKLLVSSKVAEFSKIILPKCGGLPRVITALGKYCKHTQKENLLENIDDGFMTWLETDQSFRDLGSLFCWMQSYFDACSDDLKPCIFYLSVFPASQMIRRKRLLMRWIAEGYSRDTSGNTALENGEELFSKLVGLSIIQPQTLDHSMTTHQSVDVCQVNGFFHEYIISRPMKDNLVFALEGYCSINTQRVGQHLTISNSWKRDEIVFRSMDLSRLRSFTVFGEWKSFFICDDVNMRLLRVLDLEDTLGLKDSDIRQIGKLLPRLKFLSLRGCMDITSLPDSLGDMRQLQTLDIKNTYIVTLPVTIIKLEKLQRIHAGTTHAPSTSIEKTSPPPAEETTSIAPAEATTSVAPAEATTSVAPAEETTSVQPAVATTSVAPAEATMSVAQAEATTSVAPAEATTSVAPAEATTSVAPAEATTSVAPAEATTPWSSWSCAQVPSLLSKSHKQGLVGGTNHNGVNFVPAAAKRIGKLTALQTLGVVNVGSASGGNTVLRELKKLTQLRRLRLSGINRKNWMNFCSAISGHHPFLESLSIRLDEDQRNDVVFANFIDILKPPTTLKTLKVYGKNTHIPPFWIKQLHNLTKVDLDLTFSTQQDINCTAELPSPDVFRRACVMPVKECELNFGNRSIDSRIEERENIDLINLQVVKIDCRYRLEISFSCVGRESVEILVVHCSTVESSLRVSGLGRLRVLKEVWLTGSYSDELKQYLQHEVAQHYNKPVLKLEARPRSSSVSYYCCV